MCVGTPVLISKTKGFWDTNLFKDQVNIYFANNSLSDWSKKIDKILDYGPEVRRLLAILKILFLASLTFRIILKR